MFPKQINLAYQFRTRLSIVPRKQLSRNLYCLVNWKLAELSTNKAFVQNKVIREHGRATRDNFIPG